MTTPRELSNRYRLIETIGFGGMSEVFLSRDDRLGRDVAIKVLRADLARDPSFYLRFRREAQNAAALNHPSIVAVYDTGEAETDDGPLPYIVMEYVDGDTLRDLVRRDGPMDPRRATAVIADVCSALDFSHQNDIVHRDIKPANIMINRAGEVKVMDFGIARAMSDSTSTMTQTAAVVGTAQYLSPEQARGERVDSRSDIYSLGCVLYEVLAGEPPFTGDSPVAVAYQHVREEPSAPSLVNPDVSDDLDSIVLKALSKNPANRYQTAAEMRADLVKVLSGQRPSAPLVMSDEERTTIFGTAPAAPHRIGGVTAAAVADQPQQAPPAHRSRMRWVFALVALLIVVGGATFFLVNRVGSGGGGQVTVPDVTDQSASDAQLSLQNLGLHVLLQRKPDPTVPKDTVIDTAPAAGTVVDKGRTVTLVVSDGPKQVSVPRLDGLTQEDAAKTLADAGLIVADEVEHKPSTDGRTGKVVAQDPSAGVTVNAGTAITLTLGSGPQMVRVPDVVGQDISRAQGNIEGAGFQFTVREADSTQPSGTVLSTDPGGGSKLEQGKTITITVSRGNQVTMPDLSGMTPSQATSALREVGWTGTTVTQHPVSTLVPADVGKIIKQSPAAGQPVAKNGIVNVDVGKLGIPD
ncbi:Stk1 family PASTA domain-containing Ser/Thr kinase [Tomitella gaofuii]|uniref:Stk1 family PASTA domain-containing Ser/Thr kinase n=1 Tax=Tomitella gaofuii TaxID=2760083 RepID=UPI0015FBD120|nr:Stk1 family PASTA domain-containing Ser/Thr kinase [Tomitella gaofuii]